MTPSAASGVTRADGEDMWEGSIPPGGYVCGACGMPVESEPCADHQPAAYAECIGDE